MAYETYPSKKHNRKFGTSWTPGSGSNHGTSYPDPGLPGCKDDRDMVKCMKQSGNSGSKAPKSYPKKPHTWFSHLYGLPS